MRVGVVMLVHTALVRAEEAIRHWVEGGCPVVVHVDQKVRQSEYNAFVTALSELENVQFAPRHRCEWGTWALIAATRSATTQLMNAFPEVRHVYLASGSCLPLRPVSELVAYLDEKPDTDFIESFTISDVPWTVGGLDKERFVLRFPFAWKRQRWLFDRYVKLQQLVRFKRRIPQGIEPHMGSQWWCLTRKTLMAILDDPRRKAFDRYFRRVWVPDESYFQTLARRHSTKIECRSLTLSKFDFQGKPHIFYNDHEALLRRSNCFVARKMWPRADALYKAFPQAGTAAEPNPSAIDRVFAAAVERRTLGRPGLYMQSRFPALERGTLVTAAPYSVLQGFADLFDGFEAWLSKATHAEVHGHLYAPDRAYFSDGSSVHRGGLSDSATLRDYNAQMFLSSLIWNNRQHHQAFQFGPADTQTISWMIAKDSNARIFVITGAWAISLFKAQGEFSDIRREAARLQQIEHEHIKVLRSPYVKARVHIQTLSDFVSAPIETLQMVVDEMSDQPRRPVTELPKMLDLAGFGQFLQTLRNQGLPPFMAGEFPANAHPQVGSETPTKPYLVR